MKFLQLSSFLALLANGFAFSLTSTHKTPVKVSMMKEKFLPALIGGAILLSNPFTSDAVQSGSRRGGSSFRSSSPPRSSTSLNSYSTRSYSSRPSYSSPSISIMPMYSPFGYGGFGFSPFGFMPVNLNVILLAGIAYAVYSVVTRGIGGSDFSSNDGASGVLGSGASIVKLSIAIDSDWEKRNNIMDQLSKLAASRGSMAGRNDLSVLLSDASMQILRHQNEWIASSYESEVYSEREFNKVEPAFQQFAVKERTKFESEVAPAPALPRESAPDGGKPTVAVVSLVVAMRGKSSAAMKSVRSVSDLKMCLQSLAADALTDEGENVLAVELLWTPSEPGKTVSQRELIVDYPELIRL